MSDGFERRRRGRVYAELPPYAAGLLASLCRQLIELLSDGEPTDAGTSDPLEAMVDFGSPRERPDDPALRRLLPDASRDDPDVAAEFRRLTEGSLRELKVADARVVLETLASGYDPEVESPTAAGEGAAGSGVEGHEAQGYEVELDAEQARAWMRTLTDLRLTLAERVEFAEQPEGYWDSLPESDEQRGVYEIFGWLGYLLETLVAAVR